MEKVEYVVQFRPQNSDHAWSDIEGFTRLADAEQEYHTSTASDAHFNTETRLIERILQERVLKP